MAVGNVNSGIIFCFAPVSAQQISLLETLRFRFISIRNTYKYTQNEGQIEVLPDEYSISPYDPTYPMSDHDIKKLAYTIGKETRYFKDPFIPESKSTALYIQWVKNSLYHGLAAKCFIAWHGETPIGICTVKIKDSHGEIDLLGVLSQFQKKNIGKQLLFSAIHYLELQGTKKITVVTAGENIKSNIFFQKNGFVIESVELVYHKHIR